MRTWLALLAATIAAILLAILATTPPRPLAADAPADRFSAERAMADVRAISSVPRPTGSAANAQARDYLINRLRSMGMETETANFTLRARGIAKLDGWRGTKASPPDGVNLIATLPGRDRSLPALLLMAHHDSVWGSPGAADDAAGVAAALETVRAVKATGQPRRDLMVLLTDAEELGLDGAHAFFTSDPRRSRVGAIINLEARGGGGRAAMFETGPRNGGMMRLFAGSVRDPVATSLSVFVYERLPNSTDFTPAKQGGYPGFNFAFIGRPSLYHSPLATTEALDRGALQDMGSQTLDLSRGLLAADAFPASAPDLTFFDAFGLFLVRYPPAWGWGLLALAVLGYGLSLGRKPKVRAVAVGAGATLALMLIAGVGLTLVNMLSAPASGYYDRLAAIPRLEVQALMVCLSALAVGAALFRRWLPDASFTAGMALPLLLLGGVAQFLAPTASYPIIIPLMLGGIALAIRAKLGGGAVAPAIAAALGAGYLIAFSFFILQAIGSGSPAVVILPLALSAVLLAPLAGPVDARTARIAAIVTIVAALFIALWVRFDAVAPSVPPYTDGK